MRFHRPLTFALTVLPSADLVRTIKSFEPAAKTLIGTTEGTDQEIRFSVPDVATTRGNRAAAHAPTEPGPGTPVIVGEHTAVSEIFLEDELNGTVKSVDPGGRRMVVTGRDSGTEVVLRTHDQPLFRAAKGDAANLSESELRSPVKVTYAGGIARKIAAQLRERSIIEDLSDTRSDSDRQSQITISSSGKSTLVWSRQGKAMGHDPLTSPRNFTSRRPNYGAKFRSSPKKDIRKGARREPRILAIASWSVCPNWNSGR